MPITGGIREEKDWPGRQVAGRLLLPDILVGRLDALMVITALIIRDGWMAWE